jgi:hypothetical protein
MPRSLRAEAARGLTAITCVAAVGVLAVAGYRGVTTVHRQQRPADIKRAAASTKLQDCLARRLQHVVPAGATIALAPTTPFFEQRLTEWSAPSVRVVTDRSQAQFVVAVKRVAGGSCNGLDVRMSRP